MNVNDCHDVAKTITPRSRIGVSSWCVAAAFGTYFCMYGFRKPFTAGLYEDIALWGIGYKTLLVTAQTIGYMISKFLGIKIVAEASAERRVTLLLTLIGIAELALLAFAITPAPFNFVWLFANGIPLGMVFGLVLGFLEGRRHTEALAAGLCTSFIVADGITKTVGARLLALGVTEQWMPFLAGLIFAPPLLLFAWMLSRVPPPDRADVAARSERTPMNSADRWSFFRRYAVGLSLLVLMYVLITVLRSVRADFAREIWIGLEGSAAPDVFGQSESIVGLLILILSGSTVFIRDNRLAFFTSLAMAGAGALLILVVLVGLDRRLLSPFAFMVLLGLGLYLPYIAVHTTIFERLIAMTRDRGNIGYLMYLADSFGYLGYVVVMLSWNWIGRREDFLPFFLSLNGIIAVACLILLALCGLSFAIHPATARPSPRPVSVPHEGDA